MPGHACQSLWLLLHMMHNLQFEELSDETLAYKFLYPVRGMPSVSRV